METITSTQSTPGVGWSGWCVPVRMLLVTLLLVLCGAALAAAPAANPCRRIDSLAGLPAQVRTLLGVARQGGMGIADRGQPFNATDVFRDDLPSKRFSKACVSDTHAIVLLDVGGFALHGELVVFVMRRGRWSEDHSVVMRGGSGLAPVDRDWLETVRQAWWHGAAPSP